MHSDEVREIELLEDRRCQALIDADYDLLADLLADDLLYTHSSGAVDGKASYLAALRGGLYRFRSIDCSDVTMRAYGDMVLVAGRADTKVSLKDGGEFGGSLRYSIGWSRTPLGWKFVFWHACELPSN